MAFTYSDISYQYIITVKNKFDTFQKTPERHTPKEEYKNFLTAHIEAAAECIQTKLRDKCRVLWESIVVREKRDSIKKSIITK